MDDIRQYTQAAEHVAPDWAHVSASGLNQYYNRYLLQKAISTFKFSNLPENWNKSYFLYCLFVYGYIGVLTLPEFGTICQKGVKGGFDIYYQPSFMLYASPFYRQRRLYIGRETEVIRLQPDWAGITDIIDHYSNLMTLCSETIGTNFINSKLSYVFATDRPALADSFKAIFSKIASGEPAVAMGKKMFTDDGKPAWTTFANNLKQNYLVSDLLADLRTIENMFDTDVGIPNANTTKRERLNIDEVNSNNVDTMCKSALWLETLRECLDKVNKKFGLNISVDYRFAEQLNGGDTDAAISATTGTV